MGGGVTILRKFFSKFLFFLNDGFPKAKLLNLFSGTEPELQPFSELGIKRWRILALPVMQRTVPSPLLTWMQICTLPWSPICRWLSTILTTTNTMWLVSDTRSHPTWGQHGSDGSNICYSKLGCFASYRFWTTAVISKVKNYCKKNYKAISLLHLYISNVYNTLYCT